MEEQQPAQPGKGKNKSSEDAELRAWADRLNVTKVQLKAAINAVGNSEKDVVTYLNRKK